MLEIKEDIYELVTESNVLTCGVITPTSSKNVVYRKYPSTRSGSQNPKWRDQVRRGQNATTAYSRSGYIVDAFKPFTYDLVTKCADGQVNKGDQYRRGTISFLPTTYDFAVTQPNATSAQNQAIMGFIHDAKAQYNSISGMTFLGELRQTLAMIRNPAQNLKALVQEYQNRAQRRRSSFRTRRDAERWLSGLWLEYAFGWVPLISDTKAGAEALARLIHGDLRYSTARGFGKMETSSKPVLSNFGPAGLPVLGQIEKFVKASETCSLKGGVGAKASGPTLENAMHLFGFTPEEFVPTVWSLTPWSFLVDYFVNVGDVLEATFFDRAGITWSSMTTRSERTAFWHTRTKTPKGWSGSTTDGSCKVTKKSMVRSQSAPFVPSLEVSLPGSPQQWLNMVALMDQHRKMVPYVR